MIMSRSLYKSSRTDMHLRNIMQVYTVEKAQPNHMQIATLFQISWHIVHVDLWLSNQSLDYDRFLQVLKAAVMAKVVHQLYVFRLPRITDFQNTLQENSLLWSAKKESVPHFFPTILEHEKKHTWYLNNQLLIIIHHGLQRRLQQLYEQNVTSVEFFNWKCWYQLLIKGLQAHHLVLSNEDKPRLVGFYNIYN